MAKIRRDDVSQQNEKEEQVEFETIVEQNEIDPITQCKGKTAMNETITTTGAKFCPLTNKKVNIKFIPRPNKRNLPENHVLYGGMMRNATRTLSVPKRNGIYTQVLNQLEQEYFEEVLHLQQGDLDCSKVQDNYWSDVKRRVGNWVELKKGDNYFDLSQIEPYMQYCVAKANINIVCPSQSEYERMPLQSYEFVIVDEGNDINFTKTKYEIKRNAYLQLGKLMDDKNIIMYLVESLTGRKVNTNTSSDALQLICYEYIEKDINKFTQLINDEYLSTKVLIRRCLMNQSIYNKGEFYYLREGNVPMCLAGENPTLQKAAAFLASPRNRELKIILESKLNDGV